MQHRSHIRYRMIECYLSKTRHGRVETAEILPHDLGYGLPSMPLLRQEVQNLAPKWQLMAQPSAAILKPQSTPRFCLNSTTETDISGFVDIALRMRSAVLPD